MHATAQMATARLQSPKFIASDLLAEFEVPIKFAGCWLFPLVYNAEVCI